MAADRHHQDAIVPTPWTRSITASPAPTVVVPETGRPEVSVLVVSYGTGRIMIDTLASIVAAHTHDRAPTIEIIVVDQPHPTRDQATMTDLRLFTSGVRVVRPATNLGFGGGCELAALHARGEVLAFVNPDIVVPAGWLAPLVEALDDPEVAIVAPVLLNPDGSVQEAGQTVDADGSTRPRGDVVDQAADAVPTTPVPVDYASAACWVMRRREHERLGGFDPAYFPAYFEDVDLALRAHALGGTSVVHTGVRVVHHRGAGTPDRPAPALAQREVLRRTWPDLAWSRASAERR